MYIALRVLFWFRVRRLPCHLPFADLLRGDILPTILLLTWTVLRGASCTRLTAWVRATSTTRRHARAMQRALLPPHSAACAAYVCANAGFRALRAPLPAGLWRQLSSAAECSRCCSMHCRSAATCGLFVGEQTQACSPHIFIYYAKIGGDVAVAILRFSAGMLDAVAVCGASPCMNTVSFYPAGRSAPFAAGDIALWRLVCWQRWNVYTPLPRGWDASCYLLLRVHPHLQPSASGRFVLDVGFGTDVCMPEELLCRATVAPRLPAFILSKDTARERFSVPAFCGIHCLPAG